MRDAKVQDFWKDAYRRSYKDNLFKVDFNGLNNLPEIDFSNGIIAICGLNGAGKSTIVASIKDLIGIELTEQDKHKLNSHIVNGIALLNGEEVVCKNQEGERLSDRGWEPERTCYIDCAVSTSAQSFLISQTNLEELIEQYEEHTFTAEEIKDLNYLIGKQYSACSVWELNDIDEQEANIPFFSVSVDGVSYDTTGMGNGEHFLFFLFWCINRVDSDTLLIIEEPETYISISSQIHFANYLGKMMAKKGVKVILTTHSPYILSNIKHESIRIVSRVGNSASIVTPNDGFSAETILGIPHNNIGTFFVEDRVAADFLTIILEDRAPNLLKQYTIDIVGGESAISERLQFPQSDKIRYNFVGIYDGDMRGNLDTTRLNWKWCFLPGNKAIEEIFRAYLHNDEKRTQVSKYLEKNDSEMIAFLSTIDGLDCHDWFNELRKHLAVEGRILVNAFYQTIMKELDEIEEFVSDVIDATVF